MRSRELLRLSEDYKDMGRIIIEIWGGLKKIGEDYY